MATFRYSVSNGLSGCYMPDCVNGPYVGSTRRELASIIRDELERMEWPKSMLNHLGLRILWKQIVRYGSSSMSFSLCRKGYSISFNGLTEDEAIAMEKEND